jgi:hypothetical protein
VTYTGLVVTCGSRSVVSSSLRHDSCS